MKSDSETPEHSKEKKQEEVLVGIGVSPGVVIGPVLVVVAKAIQIVERNINAEDIELEISKFEEALIETRRQIQEIQEGLGVRTPKGDSGILDAHLMVLDDASFLQAVISGIHTKKKNVETIVKEAAESYANALALVEDNYIRERIADIRDVSRRIIRNLSGDTNPSKEELQHKHIIVARDLAPSETASLRKDMVIGFATDLGSPTSHTAVMARALEIPAIVGLRDITNKLTTGDEVLIDGNKGTVIIHPSPKRLEEYGRVAEARKNIVSGLTNLRDEPAETADGHRIVLSANMEQPGETDAVLKYGAQGVGLFRTEYLYLSKGAVVSEEEQSAVYNKVAAALAPRPVIIRTLDLGGDKYLSGAELPHEANPFLGCRSIRLSLLQPKHFKGQLRAILRASVHGNVKIMYPMISNAGEVVRANELLEEAKGELSAMSVPFQKDIDVGAMIEIPAAALTADVIAKHVKFFSLGTNDLIQYTIAVDRINERVAYLYEPTHPAVLKLIQLTIDAGHRNGIWVGVCGEMAADPLMTPLLLGMGVDELSVAPSVVPMIKDAVRSVRYSGAKDLAKIALSCKSAVEVLSHCRRMLNEVAPEILELV
ncbi:MAG: phosphoenolpyruvate--protein phosphotransferase [Lentisphaerae bacterium RIFOXYA12_FULL_48_11]|nr:MAG: phosphoenolpyruvate--protein phosphotransferase [Lentisphaerae bacterium RIFOXYA12_FULL_48_11]